MRKYPTGRGNCPGKFVLLLSNGNRPGGYSLGVIIEDFSEGDCRGEGEGEEEGDSPDRDNRFCVRHVCPYCVDPGHLSRSASGHPSPFCLLSEDTR